ncbi:hypothetical protein SAMN05192533_1045 [Mesobacillus persicus]|uniref:Iron complex transport system substrate-binding protein n=1 Tax=Mesobacillus persicus TaxID=930146 RepID=A0A1H7ZMD4_9BACI|nr:hypothetical protein [Mesobacillus persicus]SEM59476.1 hypothetical protein SAMN05192533_1045 [Mesobacillus persicus]
MKYKFLIPFLISILFLAACGQTGLEKPITLVDQNNEEVEFPTGEPVVFFFITSYT